MAITSSELDGKITYELGGGLGTYTVGVEDDAGTERIAHRYNGALIRWVTPAGGHVEDKVAGSLPTGYEVG